MIFHGMIFIHKTKTSWCLLNFFFLPKLNQQNFVIEMSMIFPK